MFNKMGNKMGKTNLTSTKFAANILHMTGRLCSKSSDNQFIFKEVTTKRSVDPSFVDPRLNAVNR